MRRALKILAVFLMIMGVIWIFQGIGVLPGSFMSGQKQWAINGGIVFIIGVALLIFTQRMTRR